ncbi:MAG: hypothetical protein AB7O24_00630 [Kofleriaceae bacterium]
MRTSIAAVCGASLLIACVGEIPGGSTGNDDIGDTGGGGGNGNGNGGGGGDGDGDGNGNGGGDDNGGGDNPMLTPRVDVSVDKPAVTSDLGVDNTIAVTVTGAMGFSGAVSLAATVVDAQGAPITGWTTAMQNVTLSENGSQIANLVIKVPGNAETIDGKVKVTATSSAAPAEVMIDVTSNPVLTVSFSADANGDCAYPLAPVNNPIRIKAGRMIRVLNNTNQKMQIHVSGIDGWDHQNNSMGPGQAYSGVPDSPGDQDQFYCHNGGDTITEGGGAARPYLRVE